MGQRSFVSSSVAGDAGLYLSGVIRSKINPQFCHMCCFFLEVKKDLSFISFQVQIIGDAQVHTFFSNFHLPSSFVLPDEVNCVIILFVLNKLYEYRLCRSSA